MLLQYKGRVMVIKGDYASAIRPLEDALRLAAAKHYFKPDAEADIQISLVQGYFSIATSKDLPVPEQRTNYLKALEHLDIWITYKQKVTPEITMMRAYILFGLANTNLGAKKVDVSYVKKAQEVIEEALINTAKPKESLYSLLISCLQQTEDYPRLAETLELLCKMTPNNKQNWQLLLSVYAQLSQDANLEKAFENTIRAIVTLDRAQALGFMNTPKDNFNRVAFYSNLQQFNMTADYLLAGLMNGSIDDSVKNWELLGSCFQQINKETKAIAALKEAARRYPDKGFFWSLIAQSYYNLDKTKEAYQASLKSIEVGDLEKPSLAYSFSANMAFQLRLFEEGLDLVNKAMAYPDSKSDTQLPKLKVALEEGIRERELNKMAIDAQHKNL
jgi:tetratricopeptide (TPR) repeat protein